MNQFSILLLEQQEESSSDYSTCFLLFFILSNIENDNESAEKVRFDKF